MSAYIPYPDPRPIVVLETVHGPREVHVHGRRPGNNSTLLTLYTVDDPFLPGSTVFAYDDELEGIDGNA